MIKARIARQRMERNLDEEFITNITKCHLKLIDSYIRHLLAFVAEGITNENSFDYHYVVDYYNSQEVYIRDKVIKKLRDRGYVVAAKDEDTITISWNQDDTKYTGRQ